MHSILCNVLLHGLKFYNLHVSLKHFIFHSFKTGSA